jgi:hypothetical protein
MSLTEECPAASETENFAAPAFSDCRLQSKQSTFINQCGAAGFTREHPSGNSASSGPEQSTNAK